MSSIRIVAHLAGVSPAAVSLALRGAGRISEETRTKILRIAADLGYEPNPILAKALSLARQAPGSRYRETIGIILEYPTETGPEFQKIMHAAASQRAESLGLKLEPFVLSDKPADHRRLKRVLKARGIRGVIIIPRLEHLQPRLHLDWSDLAAVEIGRTLWNPRNLHHVETSDYNKVIEAIHLLKKAGYKRIGMAVEPMQNQHQRGTYYAAYLMSQLRQPERLRIPVLASTGPWGEATFRKWLKRHNPDVLFIHNGYAPIIHPWLKRLGMSCPDDISLFYVNALDSAMSGMVRDYAGLGRSAVEMLSLLLESGEIGLPARPRSWLVDESWQAGTTLAHPITKFISDQGGLLPDVLPRPDRPLA
ncbi:MAG: LacI family DNA-binding transcriptional regulator [Opitutaceae bacterium]|jgi:LacI family transcriptional regulator